MAKNYYVSGEYNATCDRCSAKRKSHEMRTEWTGLFVCKDCFENRQPQDFVRAKQDKISVPIVRPIPTLVFTDVTYVDTGNTTIPPGNNNGNL